MIVSGRPAVGKIVPICRPGLRPLAQFAMLQSKT